jgi:hypothetical protein
LEHFPEEPVTGFPKENAIKQECAAPCAPVNAAAR